jgi:hypothetical protein
MSSNKKLDVAIVVHANEVEGRGLEGYRIAEIIYNDRMEHGVETTADDENGFGGQYGNRTHSVTKPLVLREPMFVMTMSTDDALARKQSEVNDLKESLNQTYEAHKIATNALEAGAKRIATFEDENKRLKDQLSAARGHFEQSQIANRKLEADIGKIREAVGSVRMKEVLGEQ